MNYGDLWWWHGRMNVLPVWVGIRVTDEPEPGVAQRYKLQIICPKTGGWLLRLSNWIHRITHPQWTPAHYQGLKMVREASAEEVRGCDFLSGQEPQRQGKCVGKGALMRRSLWNF